MSEREIQQSFTDDYRKIEELAGAYLGFQHDREEALAECVGLAWQAYRKLSLEGRDVVSLLGKIVEFSAKRVRSGKGLTNINPARDILSRQNRFRYRVHAVADSIGDDSPAEEACFRVDFQEWSGGLDERRQAIVSELLAGYNTVEVAEIHQVSRMRIFQLREELLSSWEEFHGESRTESVQN